MKKSLLILAAVAFVASSCTKTEVIEDTPTKGINFSAYTAKPTRTAQEDVTNSTLNSFEVTAIGNGATYFDNVTFRKSTVWESNPEYFWPAFALNFYAYNTPLSATASFRRNITTSGQTLVVKPSPELANQEDLVAAYAGGKTEGNVTSDTKSLEITFNHYLTQVVVKAKCSNPLYSVLVDGVKLANMADEGTYTFGNPGAMVATTDRVNSRSSVDYIESFSTRLLTTDPKEVMTDTDQKGRWYLIPQTVRAWKREAKVADSDMKNNDDAHGTAHGTYLALKVKITANGGTLKIYPANGDESGWMAVPVPDALKFEQGKKYVITVDFFSETGKGAGYVDPETPSDLDGNGNANDDNGKNIIGGAIKFDATVSDWDPTVDITISL